MSESVEVIDLTDSFIYVDHCATNDVLIMLDTDDSFSSPPPNPNKRSKNNGKTRKIISSTTDEISGNNRRSGPRKSKKLGDCPVCLDELGKNPLASTKCGHVFCLKCLEKSLLTQKKCPTCRLLLKKNSDYHPLYLYY